MKIWKCDNVAVDLEKVLWVDAYEESGGHAQIRFGLSDGSKYIINFTQKDYRNKVFNELVEAWKGGDKDAE